MDIAELFGDVALAFLLLGFLILAGKIVRVWVPGLRKLFMPVSLIAGAIGMLLGPQVLGAMTGDEGWFADGLFPENVRAVWGELPGLLISVVFAAMFIGKPIPSLGLMWQRSGPQVMFGHTLAWGQYVIGISLAMFVLYPIWGTSPLAGALLEMSLVGGHGTVAGMQGAFEELGFPEGTDLGLGLATIGILAGVIIGTVLVNWAARTGRVDLSPADEPGDVEQEKLADFDEKEDVERSIPEPEVPGAEGKSEGEDKPVDPLSVHVALLGLAVGIGWVLQQALLWVESVAWASWWDLDLFRYLPLFPLAMIGAMILQVVLEWIGYDDHVDRRLVNRISGASLDMIIVSALATLSLAALGAHWGPLLVLAVAGITWNVVGFLVLAPRMIPKHWFARGAGDFGQSIGMAALGLLLIRLADPQDKARASERFGYKQVLFEPLVGGGLFTAASVPLLAQFGAGPMLIVVTVVTLGFLVGGLWLFKGEAER
ncbi:sodium/glutamate symporter [Phycisphaerales bacterium AB-hyl4]|uniref:Sodium/glutamate symporter n=1 Tax=Natronomicrosphaera hydrolytica TaxID=3242702 RepID=A0ABV4U349_9BACT